MSDMLNPVQRHVETHPIALATAQESILPDESVLEYVLAEPASYCIALTRTHATIVEAARRAGSD